MTKPLKLNLKIAVFDTMWKVAHGRGKSCTIAKKDLTALLMDHSLMHGALLDQRVETTEPGYDKI